MRARTSMLGTTLAIAASLVVSGCADGAHPHVVPSAHKTSAAAGYQQQVDALVRDWGSVAVQGMRPAIADLAHRGGVPRAGIATEATAWTAALTQDRERLQHVMAPASYERTRRLLLRSLDGYLHAAAIVHAAAQQPDRDRRRAALQRAVHVLTAADRIFDLARSSGG